MKWLVRNGYHTHVGVEAMEGAKRIGTNAPLERAVAGRVSRLIEFGIMGASMDRKSFWLWQILELERVESGPVDNRLLETRRVNRWRPELPLKIAVILGNLLLRGDIGEHPQGGQLVVEQAVRDHVRSRL